MCGTDSGQLCPTPDTRHTFMSTLIGLGNSSPPAKKETAPAVDSTTACARVSASDCFLSTPLCGRRGRIQNAYGAAGSTGHSLDKQMVWYSVDDWRRITRNVVRKGKRCRSFFRNSTPAGEMAARAAVVTRWLIERCELALLWLGRLTSASSTGSRTASERVQLPHGLLWCQLVARAAHHARRLW